jgi:hypothetical protein
LRLLRIWPAYLRGARFERQIQNFQIRRVGVSAALAM